MSADRLAKARWALEFAELARSKAKAAVVQAELEVAKAIEELNAAKRAEVK